MGLTLGSKPLELDVELPLDGDFVQPVTLQDANGQPTDWQDGESLSLLFSDGTTWDAQTSGSTALWDVDKAVVATKVEDIGGSRRVKMIYTTAEGRDIVIAVGKAVVTT